MKIWEATLNLTNDGRGHWLVGFYFESDGRDYGLVNQTYCENHSGWVSRQIPAAIEIEQYYGSFTVRQGFDRELNKEELEALESKMNSTLIEKLERDKATYLEAFDEKVVALGGPRFSL